MLLSLTKDTVTPDLKRLLREVDRPQSLFEAGAKTAQRFITRHLRDLEARGNKKGWPSQHFFAGGKNAVEKNVGIASVTPKSAVITIADVRFVHRILGGTVTPKRAGALAIPLTAEAYGLAGKGTLRESMPGLILFRTARGAFLGKSTMQKVAGRKGLKRQQIKALFILLKSVTHKPHPNELPDQARMGAEIHDAMAKAAAIMIHAGRSV